MLSNDGIDMSFLDTIAKMFEAKAEVEKGIFRQIQNDKFNKIFDGGLFNDEGGRVHLESKAQNLFVSLFQSENPPHMKNEINKSFGNQTLFDYV